MSRILTRRRAVLLALLSAVVLAGLTRAVWVSASGADLSGTIVDIDVTGQQAAPPVLALALAAGAAAAATSLSSRWVRWVTGPVLVLCGAGAAAAVGVLLADPVSAARPAVIERTGVTGGQIAADAGALPLLALVPAALLIALGAGVLLAGGRWPLRTRSRFERDARESERAAAADPGEDPAAVWDALSRGEDPSEPREPSPR